jgi:hypothetical protein
MRAGRDRHRQAARHGDAPPEAHQLHRDLPLVMVHGHDRIHVARAVRLGLGAQEDGVGRIRSLAGQATAARFLQRGADQLDLLAADACVTWAFEAASDAPTSLGARAEAAMQRIAEVAG